MSVAPYIRRKMKKKSNFGTTKRIQDEEDAVSAIGKDCNTFVLVVETIFNALNVYIISYSTGDLRTRLHHY